MRKAWKQPFATWGKAHCSTTPPSSTTNAVVNVNPVTGTYASGLGFFDAGVKLAYHFNFPKKRYFKNTKLF